MSDQKRTLAPDGVFHGLFEGYLVHANRHETPTGEKVWHTRSYRNSGDLGLREYWVENGEFRKALKSTMNFDGKAEHLTGDIEEPEPAEKSAILAAINEWESESTSSLASYPL